MLAGPEVSSTETHPATVELSVASHGWPGTAGADVTLSGESGIIYLLIGMRRRGRPGDRTRRVRTGLRLPVRTSRDLRPRRYYLRRVMVNLFPGDTPSGRRRLATRRSLRRLVAENLVTASLRGRGERVDRVAQQVRKVLHGASYLVRSSL